MKQSQCFNMKKTFPLVGTVRKVKKSRMTGGIKSVPIKQKHKSISVSCGIKDDYTLSGGSRAQL
jgi:hypothetical protein